MQGNAIHSKFLIHWTGYDFDDFSDLTDEKRAKYVERLRDTYRKGFYMNPGEEEIWGRGGEKIRAKVSRTCFTEIRLAQSQKHAYRFGRMGIGVHRNFIVEREGNPVFYVQNGEMSAAADNFIRLRDYMSGLSGGGAEEALESLEVILGYLKNMSDRDSRELKYYEEMEWRIVYLNRLMGKYFYKHEGDHKPGIYRIRLKPEDVAVVVFPDDKTRELALQDESIRELFGRHLPIAATLSECRNF